MDNKLTMEMMAQIARQELDVHTAGYRFGYIDGSRIYESEGLAYRVSPDDPTECIITGMGTCTDVDLCIPSEIDGMRVTCIGLRAFESVNLRSVVFPMTVTSVESNAFRSTGLKVVRFPKRLLEGNSLQIAMAAFTDCAIESLTLPYDLGYVNSGAFEGSEETIKYIRAPGHGPTRLIDGVLVNDAGVAFLSRPDVEHVDFGDITVQLKPRLFKNRINLIDVKANGSIDVPASCFEGCEKLTSVPKVRNVHSYAFKNCTSLSAVTLEHTVAIDAQAFANCVSLEYITIPEDVIVIGLGAFSGCVNVTRVDYNARNMEPPLTSTEVSRIDNERAYEDYPFYNLGIARNATTLNVGPSVKRIPGYLFFSNTYDDREIIHLTSVFFAPNSICTHIDERAFYACYSLVDVYFCDSITDIGAHAFRKCSLRELRFSADSELMVINSAAFAYTSLRTVSLPPKVTTVHNDVFKGCVALQTVNINSDVVIGKKAFDNCPRLLDIYIHVVDVLNSTSLSAAPWTNVPVTVHYPDEVITYGSKNLTYIEYSTYAVCTGGTPTMVQAKNETPRYSLTIASHYNGKVVREIDPTAFSHMSQVNTLVIPDGITYIGDGAFSYMKGLDTIYLRANELLSVDSSVFEESGSEAVLGTQLYIGESVKCIPERFLQAYSRTITHLEFKPGSVCEQIGQRAFYRAMKGCRIEMPKHVKSIGQHAFRGCLLEGLFFSEDSELIDIKGCAFKECRLDTLTLPASVEIIEHHAFANSSLTTFRFKGTPLDISDNPREGTPRPIFADCYNLAYIYMPWSRGTDVGSEPPFGAINAREIYNWKG